jgi:hypothetical protein
MKFQTKPADRSGTPLKLVNHGMLVPYQSELDLKFSTPIENMAAAKKELGPPGFKRRWDNLDNLTAKRNE